MPPRPLEALSVSASAAYARRRRVVARGLGGAWVGLAPERSAARLGRAADAAGARSRAADVVPKRGRRRVAGAGAPARRRLALSHAFSPRLAGAAAVLVDAKTGRVLWGLHAHERRQVASTTKIMTALLALRKLRPHDIVTVDKSVPRVPLVREGLRAGEHVEAWKLFYSLLLFSGNDDALALAIAAGGDKWTFVRVDERRGEAARAPRHALLDAERRRGRGQLLERVGPRRADARRDAEPALPADRANPRQARARGRRRRSRRST